MEVFIDIPSLPSLVPGSLIPIQVTSVTNCNRFYAILPRGTRCFQTDKFVDEDESETLESFQVNSEWSS